MSGMIEAWSRGFDKIKAGCEISLDFYFMGKGKIVWNIE